MSIFLGQSSASSRRLVSRTSYCLAALLLVMALAPTAVGADCVPVTSNKPIVDGTYYINGLGDENGCLVTGGDGTVSTPLYLWGNFPTKANPPVDFGNSKKALQPLGVGTNDGTKLQIVALPPLGGAMSNPAVVWAQIPGQSKMSQAGTYEYENVWQSCTERGQTGTSRYFTVHNNCSDTVYMVMTPPGVPQQWAWWQKNYGQGSDKNQYALAAGATSEQFMVPDCGAPSGNFRFFTGCTDSTLKDCIVGDLTGDLAGIATLFEPTFGCKPSIYNTNKGKGCAVNPAAPVPGCSAATPQNCPPLASPDNFDISAVDGYDFSMTVEAVGQATCNRTTTDGSMLDLASCPSEDGSTLYSGNASQEILIEKGISLLTTDAKGNYRACAAPNQWFNTTTLGNPANPDRSPCANGSAACYYGCSGCPTAGGSGPGCGGVQCKVGPTPAQDGSKAINNTHWVTELYAMGYEGYTWAYGDGIGLQQCDWGVEIEVTLCPSGGVPYEKTPWQFASGQCTKAAGGTYDSLVACQQANMKYGCSSEGMCTIDTSGGGTDYATCAKSLKLDCTKVSVGNSSYKNCNSTCGGS